MGYRTHEEYSILYPLYGTGLRTRFFVDLVMNFNISNNILVISEYHLSDDPHDDSGISNGGAIRVYGWARVPFSLFNYFCSYLFDIQTCSNSGSKSGSEIFVDFLRNPQLSKYSSSTVFSHDFSPNIHANVNLTGISYPDLCCHNKCTSSPWTSVGFISEFCVMNGNTGFIVSFKSSPISSGFIFSKDKDICSEFMVSFISKIRIW